MLAVNLVLLVVCALGLLLTIAGYLVLKPRAFRSMAPTATHTLRPTLTWTQFPTATLTPTPSATSRQTSTPTPTQTLIFTSTPASTDFPLRTFLPSLTPAAALVYDGAYQLLDWDEFRADHMALTMQGFPQGMLSELKPDQEVAYFQAYQYPAFAYREALLQFPEASAAERWRWALAYNSMLTGSAKAGELYAGLIADNLNRGQTSIEELYAWFPIQESALTLFLVQGSLPPGRLESYIVELRGLGGSSFIWLLRKSAGYEAYSIWTRFDFVHPRRTNWILADLDNNPSNGPEMAIYQSTLGDETTLQPVQVISLAKAPPVQLPFIPGKDIFEIGTQYQNYWAVQTDHSGVNELIFRPVVFPTCPLEIKLPFRWNGLYFKRAAQQIEFAGLPKNPGMCEPLIDISDRFWEPETTAGLMETLLPQWPPEKDANGEPYPPDALDEWKYRLGVLYALSGKFDLAVNYLDEVVNNPTTANSRWIDPAHQFLAAYHKPEDIYNACWLAPYCDPAHAIRFLTRQIPSSVDALQYLRNWGVQIVSSGFFDFDDDDEGERWFTVRNSPNQKLDFWILARSKGYHQALEVGIVETRIPTINFIEEPFIADEGLSYQPAALLDGKISFSMQRFPDTRESFLVQVPLRKEYPSRFFEPLFNYRDALFTGTSPDLIQKKLEDLQDFPGLLCKSTWSCDEYYYLLGLASELAGDAQTAVENYQRLWLDYTKSPFTQMARLKLDPIGGLPTATEIPTSTPLPVIPTPTETIFITPTPTITGTPPTATPSGEVSLTPTVTGTVPTGTPSPTVTSSPGSTQPYPQPNDIPSATPYPPNT
ncbi:MAG: hypothetical protein B6D39_09845 [Anaerolineae bacterium UTCFX2]|nr:MAG: hypothetical protein B6D39_09845 [Anaerolineae bacterium UTCFX2]